MKTKTHCRFSSSAFMYSTNRLSSSISRSFCSTATHPQPTNNNTSKEASGAKGSKGFQDQGRRTSRRFLSMTVALNSNTSCRSRACSSLICNSFCFSNCETHNSAVSQTASAGERGHSKGETAPHLLCLLHSLHRFFLLSSQALALLVPLLLVVLPQSPIMQAISVHNSND